jgi:hypothetical protein
MAKEQEKNLAFFYFTKENMVAIEKNWDNISESVKKAIELLAKYG